MITVSCPSQFQAYPNLVCALGTTGPWSSASFQVRPLLVDTSTLRMAPAPDHANPVTSQNPGCASFCPPAGRVITELAPISNRNQRALWSPNLPSSTVVL